MPRPLLPPRGIEAPTEMLYDKNVSPAIRDTWLQLRGLAWGKRESPPMSVERIAEICGKSPSTIYEHMRLLRDWSALEWSTTEQTGYIVISFPVNLTVFSENSEKLIKDSINQDTSKEEVNIPNFRNSGKGKAKNTVPAEILRPIVDAIEAVTGMDKRLNYARMARDAKKYHLAGYSANQILKIYGEGGIYWRDDWRGKQGQVPNTATINQTIARYASMSNGRTAGAKPLPSAPTPEEIRRELREAKPII